MNSNSYTGLFDFESRELKVVRVFFIAVALLLVFQTIQFINTRRIDKKHSELLVIKNQSVGALQNVLVQSSTIQRKLLNFALTSDVAERKELENIIDSAAASNDNSLVELKNLTSKLIPGENDEVAGLIKASQDYRNTYHPFIDLLIAGEDEAAMEFKNTRLRPAYESYQYLQQQMLVGITNDLIMQSNKLSSYTTTSSWILFFLGLAPFIYAIGKLMYLSILFKFKSARIIIQQKESENKI